MVAKGEVSFYLLGSNGIFSRVNSLLVLGRVTKTHCVTGGLKLPENYNPENQRLEP